MKMKKIRYAHNVQLNKKLNKQVASYVTQIFIPTKGEGYYPIK